ncbi:MAG: T9SS type A sorting domain-containing protein [Chitinophagales bacterium]|nr:T9SS type A sorting domain-containing protein [Chitinophagales bacterium]
MRLFLLLCLALVYNFSSASNFDLFGIIRLKNTQTTLSNIEVKISGNKFAKTIQTNRFGEFNISLKTGTYTIVIQDKRYTSLKEKITINRNTYRVFYVEQLEVNLSNNRTDLKYSRTDRSEMRKSSAMPPAGIISTLSSMEVAGARADEIPASKRKIDGIAIPSTPEKSAPQPKPGLLTAGEINDFQKWELWHDISSEVLSAHQKTWNLNPRERYAVQLINSNHNPIVDAIVLLQDPSGKVIWRSKSDNTGKAELWSNFIHDSTKSNPSSIAIHYNKQNYTIEKIKPIREGINSLQIKTPCAYSNNMDIAFVVDATGSMGDEIQYLKEEMQDVIQKVQIQDQSLSIRTSSVFYKDFGDDYLTKISPFTTNISLTSDFIKEQSAGGGGDFPEAVDEALAVGIRDLNWSENARARIIFLVLDAPPHQDKEIIKRIQDLIQEASAKGIRIIPLSASGIDKSTEYLMRCIALGTNGTYTFLTNHSGIGGDHIAPTTDTFKVELVNDLLARVLFQFSYIPPCNSYDKKDSIEINNENPFQIFDVTNVMKVYPNPTSDFCTVELPEFAEQLFLSDMSGKILEQIGIAGQTRIQINVSNYPVGMYFIRCLKNNKWLTEKLVVVR